MTFPAKAQHSLIKLRGVPDSLADGVYQFLGRENLDPLTETIGGNVNACGTGFLKLW